MINYICNTTKSNEIFITTALNNEDAIFAPKLIHAGPMTIIDYISFGKKDLKLSDIQPIFDLLEIKNPHSLLSSLPVYKQMLIHYFSHLIIDREHVLIELPASEDMDLLFIDLLFQIIEQIDFTDRRLTIITNDPRITTRNLKKRKQCQLKSYKFDPNWWLILKEYIGRKGTILVSLFLTISLIILSVQVDNNIIDDETEHLLVPADLVAIQNTSGSCDFNQYSYKLDIGECPNDDPITYLQIKSLLEDDRVEAVYFDDKNHLLNLNNDIATNNHPTASVPDLDHDFSNVLPTLPCVDVERTAEGIVCEEYDPTTSLISKATKDDFVHLQQNIDFDDTSAPDYIFLETNNNNTIAKTIATSVPSISVYTAFTAQKYIFHANSNLLISVFIVGTLVSVLIAVSFFLLMNYCGITIRGLRYRLMFQTGRPLYVKRLYFFSQTLYFGALVSLGSLVSINITHSLIGFSIGLYFGLLNSVLWITLAIKLSPTFSEPETQLLKDIAIYNLKQKNKTSK